MGVMSFYCRSALFSSPDIWQKRFEWPFPIFRLSRFHVIYWADLPLIVREHKHLVFSQFSVGKHRLPVVRAPPLK